LQKKGENKKIWENTPCFGALLAPFSCYTESITKPMPDGEEKPVRRRGFSEKMKP
jgi:hypothetical protein